ncbi:TBC1 domain family member 1 [Hondaea fermentalgiana]|uniref:TBC1 domain family member 1 n=1 Tax=Hondaea fermentalgiana TaxID=2315210 RepID=A0A2R5GSY9_9STRA|nr:TBC1 domain family member 1 [Hondaea fermentalgiana]|eukprot:GBG30994.1 TBC1 domain family member 1 [Hondaea fermentalgiana]
MTSALETFSKDDAMSEEERDSEPSNNGRDNVEADSSNGHVPPQAVLSSPQTPASNAVQTETTKTSKTTLTTTTTTTTITTTMSGKDVTTKKSRSSKTVSIGAAMMIGAQSPSRGLLTSDMGPSQASFSSSTSSLYAEMAPPPAPPPSRNASSKANVSLDNETHADPRGDIVQRHKHTHSVESYVTVHEDEDDGGNNDSDSDSDNNDDEKEEEDEEEEKGKEVSSAQSASAEGSKAAHSNGVGNARAGMSPLPDISLDGDSNHDDTSTETDSPPTKSPSSSSDTMSTPSPLTGDADADAVIAVGAVAMAVGAATIATGVIGASNGGDTTSSEPCAPSASGNLTSKASSHHHTDDDEEDDPSVMADILQGHLDRYGFATMDTRQPDASSALSMARTRQTYVSKVETARQRRHRVRLETLRTQKWIRMLDTWNVQLTKKRSRLNRRVRKGVPDCLRDKVWVLLVDEALKKLDVAPPGNAQATAEALAVDSHFDELLAATNNSSDPEVEKIRECISRDIGRTFPRHVIFHRRGGVGQLALTNVLRAYAALDAEVGYCQGMGFLVGFLLGYLPERKAFHVLRELMLSSPWSMCELYKPGMPGSQLLLAQFDALLQRYVPDIAQHLEKEMIVPSMYATQWFITVFTYNFPFDVVVRVWDIFLFEGWCIVHQVALAILKVNRKALLSRRFEQILEFFRDIPPTLDPQVILDVALTIPVSEKELAAIAADLDASSPGR